jgi:glycosyltransferase involved in cell wall biosynthesis
VKKFLFVLPTDKIGGAERVALNLIKYLSSISDSYIVVYFLTGRDSNSWDAFRELKNIELIYQNSKKVSTSSFRFSIFINKKSFDYVYSTHAHCNALLSFYKSLRLLKCKYLIFRESSILSTRFSGIKKFLISLVYLFYGQQDLIITQTNLMTSELINSRGRKRTKNVKCIPNPVDINSIAINSNAYDVIVGNNKFRIIAVGRLVKIKNFNLLIKSVALLDVKYRELLEVVILGSGPELLTLKNLIKELKLCDIITFPGNKQNPYPYMKNSNLGIISSFSEGFPNVLLEMMASGTNNIITTPCTGDLDKLKGVTILNSFEANELAKEIQSSIINEINNRELYIECISERTVDKYWHSIIEQLNNEE